MGADEPIQISSSVKKQLASVPRGSEILALTQKLATTKNQPWVHVCVDDAELDQLSSLAQFFMPSTKVIVFPAWDTVPYDRVSPSIDIIGKRLHALAEMVNNPTALVLTTVNAVMQRLLPKDKITSNLLELKVGGKQNIDLMLTTFTKLGYDRTSTVREVGEFAVRGGIVDIFPAGAPQPVRLDFFGETLEGIRTFDALSQVTSGEVKSVSLYPANEIDLSSKAVDLFRTRFREQFGHSVQNHPMYTAVLEGRTYPGLENWMPLFYPDTTTVFDYMPKAGVSFTQTFEPACTSRLEQVQDYYQARLEAESLKSKTTDDSPAYLPLKPEHLYLTAESLAKALDGREVVELLPHKHPTADEDLNIRAVPDFAEARTDPNREVLDDVVAWIKSQNQEQGRQVIVTAYSEGSKERLVKLLTDHGLGDLQGECATYIPTQTGVFITLLPLEHGFVSEQAVFITEQDILGDRLVRRGKKKRKAEEYISEASALATGDLVVHDDHGVGRFIGLEAVAVGGVAHDCVVLEYSNNDKLFLPVENLDLLSRYGAEGSDHVLDKLGSAIWQKRKSKVKNYITELAGKLMKIAAERELRKGPLLQAPEKSLEEFCARFPFTETDDQLRAVEETLVDLTKGRPMDRLICGDVGFGKTEVAMRAAFVAAMTGKQVAVVVPSTLLSRQHYHSFAERFAGLPVRIAQLSRMVTPKQADQVKQDLKQGRVDIVVGTHALLGKSVEFKELGLLIVDEEQHFGVTQKEKLKELKQDVHVLTLSATPIPRTLQLALTGVKDLSIIATPPVDRLAVRTFVLPYDFVTIQEAIQRERFRGGQVFYVCPRVKDLPKVQEKLQGLAPDAKVAVAHGGMNASELDQIMAAFSDGEYDILLATHIVESGLDIPNANTMIIHRGDMFGLSQLYQLRGRVGRSKTRGYCYITLPPGKKLTESATKRLEVMQTLDHLGAGFTLASHDLDIRGAGNMVGEEQSGHIKEVGVELYQSMLQDAIAKLRAEQKAGGGEEGTAAQEATFTPSINLGASVLIPEAYVEDLSVRLSLYRRMTAIETREEMDAFAAELIDRFGPYPDEVRNLLDLILIKRLCVACNIEKVDAGPKGAVFTFYQDRFDYPDDLIAYLAKQSGTVRIRPDQKLVANRAWGTIEQRLEGVQSLLTEISTLGQN